MGEIADTIVHSWKSFNPVMIWSNKIVPKLYGWSDLVIKKRQDKVNYKYRIDKAEKKAYEIMKAQQEQRANAAAADEEPSSVKTEEEVGRRRKRRAFREWDVV